MLKKNRQVKLFGIIKTAWLALLRHFAILRNACHSCISWFLFCEQVTRTFSLGLLFSDFLLGATCHKVIVFFNLIRCIEIPRRSSLRRTDEMLYCHSYYQVCSIIVFTFYVPKISQLEILIFALISSFSIKTYTDSHPLLWYTSLIFNYSTHFVGVEFGMFKTTFAFFQFQQSGIGQVA